MGQPLLALVPPLQDVWVVASTQGDPVYPVCGGNAGHSGDRTRSRARSYTHVDSLSAGQPAHASRAAAENATGELGQGVKRVAG